MVRSQYLTTTGLVGNGHGAYVQDDANHLDDISDTTPLLQYNTNNLDDISDTTPLLQYNTNNLGDISDTTPLLQYNINHLEDISDTTPLKQYDTNHLDVVCDATPLLRDAITTSKQHVSPALISESINIESDVGIQETSSTIKNTSKPSLYQVVIILVGSLFYIGAGMVIAWPNSFALDLATDNTTLLNTQLNPMESHMDLISSINLLGSFTGMMPGGWLIGRLGRRRVIIISVFGLTFIWAMTALSINMDMIFIDRYLLGVLTGVAILSQKTFTIEICSTSIRGTMMSTLEISRVLGYIAAPTFSLITTWYHIAFINAALMLIYGTVIILFFPESPSFLAINGQYSEARCVLTRLRSPNSNIEEELQQLQLLNQQEHRGIRWADLFKECIKPILTIIGLSFFISFSGFSVIRANLARILQRFSLPFNTRVSTVLVSIATLGGSIAATVLVDRVGRCWCLKIMMILLVIAYTILAIFNHQATSQQPQSPVEDIAGQDHLHNIIKSEASVVQTWVTLICFLIIFFAGHLGSYMPMVLCLEYFPARIRSQGMGVCMAVAILMTFLAMQLFSLMMTTLGVAGLLGLYASVSALSLVYIWKFVWETKNMRLS